jgi:hypothetical protein
VKEFVKELFPIWSVVCLEYCREVIAWLEEREKRRETSDRLSDAYFVNLYTEYCISNTPRYVQSWGVGLDLNRQSEG